MESFDAPIVLIIIALLSFIGTLTLIMIALGSVYMLVHNWNRNATNERLIKLEDGQAKLEKGQANLDKVMQSVIGMIRMLVKDVKELKEKKNTENKK